MCPINGGKIKELDEGYGFNLYYYGARYYNSEWGRFISPDPLREYYNKYSYCWNDPVNVIDRDGRGGDLVPQNPWNQPFQPPDIFNISPLSDYGEDIIEQKRAEFEEWKQERREIDEAVEERREDWVDTGMAVGAATGRIVADTVIRGLELGSRKPINPATRNLFQLYCVSAGTWLGGGLGGGAYDWLYGDPLVYESGIIPGWPDGPVY